MMLSVGIEFVTEQHKVKEIVEHLMKKPVVGFDLETTGLDPRKDRIRLASFATDEGSFVVDAFRVPLEGLRVVFSSNVGPTLVGHNLKFDIGFLLQVGLWEAPGYRLWDTGIAHQVIHASSRMPALKDLVPGLDKALQVSDWSGDLTEDQIEYAAKDARVVLELYRKQHREVFRRDLARVLRIENRALPAVAWMEVSGVPVDRDLWSSQASMAEKAMSVALENLPKGVNWNSPAQVKAAFKKEGIELPDTREETLTVVEHPLAKALMEYKTVAKRVSTYGSNWLKHVQDGRVYPSWKQIGAETGRMACTSPNMQQLPREASIRRAIKAADGNVFIKADYSQIELRIAAVISKDPRMLEAFRTGQDLHRTTASLVMGVDPDAVTKEDRQVAKALNFGLIYGLGATKLQTYARTAYGVELTLEEANAFRHRFFRGYQGIGRWHRSQASGMAEVKTLTGRTRYTERFTEMLNTPVQGTGADGLKTALAFIWERRQYLKGARPILAVHDELVLEAPEEHANEAARELQRLMVDAMRGVVDQKVPVEVEYGLYRDWGVTPVD